MPSSSGSRPPPVDGAANDALIAFLAELFDRPKRDVTIVSGHTSRQKRIAIAGLTEDQVVGAARRYTRRAGLKACRY